MIDVDHQLTAVTRTVGDRTLEAGAARVFTISRVYDTTVDDLWDACTNAERIPRWFLPVTGDLRIGGRYQLEGNAGGEVLTCEPPHRFTATWEYGESVTWIDVEVAEEGAGARFSLSHVAPIDAQWEEFGPGAMGIGWELGFVGLTLHLASGAAVDPGPVQAWTLSPEGLRFMAGSGEAWCAADIAGGEDPTQARAAADRTIAAYTAPPAEAG